jgi:alkylation response protein AidB-like acyl-CoA dehydrogenase
MTLTDPRAGGNLGVLRTKALLQADVDPRVRGNKIFISGGITTRSATTGKDVEPLGPCT